MANGHPTFGNGTPVTVLDIGQRGGTLHDAGSALADIVVTEMPDEPAQGFWAAPQQAWLFRTLGGMRPRQYRWDCIIRASIVGMDAIVAAIEQHKTGVSRDSYGNVLEFDLDQVKATYLTRSDGTVVSNYAVLVATRMIGRREREASWAAMEHWELVFRALR